MSSLLVSAPDGVGEITSGTDLAEVVLQHCELVDGDVLVVTSKVVSKAEGRVRPASEEDYEEALAEESVRVVARRGPVRIVRHRLGMVMAAAGIDRSNVTSGQMVLLPLDPDASARRLRSEVRARTGRNVGVVVTDTAGRAWRHGQTDIAVGAAGLGPLEDFAGRTDGYGNPLAVTAPAVVDEIAGAAELAQGKLGGRPFAVVRGRADLVLSAGQDGPGASALVRSEGEDMFGLGAREAVLAALRADPSEGRLFGAPVPAAELEALLQGALPGTVRTADADVPGALRLHLDGAAEHAPTSALVSALAFAHGWRLRDWHPDGSEVLVLLTPAGP